MNVDSSRIDAAFDLWFTGLSASTCRAYRDAWRSLKQFRGAVPATATKAQVKGWVQAMKIAGLADGTIGLRLAGVSSFYNFYNDDFAEDGESLINPARARRLRPKVNSYGKAIYLQSNQAKAFLAVMDQSTVQGARDYALYLTYILTARRNSELRNLRYRDISYSGDSIWYIWSGKGKRDQRYEMPPQAWEAIQAYLKIAGREDIQPEEYIFSSIFSHGKAPLTMQEVGRKLKKYALAAGLDAKRLHVHCLRHTGAMLRKQAGEDITQISRDLGHSSLDVTSIYLHVMEGRGDSHSGKVFSLIS